MGSLHGGQGDNAAARMITLHEIMHAELNDSTAWGSLFHAYAALARYAPRPGDFREASLDVIGACRRSHEVFATYTRSSSPTPQPGGHCWRADRSTWPTTTTRAFSQRGSPTAPSSSGTQSSA
jgi:hypothetical protein